MACTIELNDLLPANVSPGQWVVGTGDPQVLTNCYNCDADPPGPPDPPNNEFTNPAVIVGFSGSTWAIPDDQPCGVYYFKYVTIPLPAVYVTGDECSDCNDCEIYEVEIVEGPDVLDPPDQIVCAGTPQKGINLWALFDCGQVTQGNPVPAYGCVDCSASGYVAKPTNCIVKEALEALGNAWLPGAGTHTGTVEGDSLNCGAQDYEVVLSFTPAYASLSADYDPATGNFIPQNLTPGESVSICLSITTQRTGENNPECNSCTDQECFLVTRQIGDNAGEGVRVQACN